VHQRGDQHAGGREQRPGPDRAVADQERHGQAGDDRVGGVGAADVHPAALAEEQRRDPERDRAGRRDHHAVPRPAADRQRDAREADEKPGHGAGGGRQQGEPGRGHEPVAEPGHQRHQRRQPERHAERVRHAAGDEVAGDAHRPDQAAEQGPGYAGAHQQRRERHRRTDQGQRAGHPYPEQGHDRLRHQAVAELVGPPVPAEVYGCEAVTSEEVRAGDLGG
jgi:hypothetical protein